MTQYLRSWADRNPVCTTMPLGDVSNAAASTAFVMNAIATVVGVPPPLGLVSTVFGRQGTVVAQYGDYDFTQIAGTVAVGQLPIFQGSTPGLVPQSAGSSNVYLCGDGSWAATDDGVF